MSTFEGRTALVTGASKGIGANIATSMATAGAAVVVNYARDGEAAQRVVDRIITGGGRAVAVQGDVSRPEDAAELFRRAREAFGRVDVLVNNAGVAAFAPFHTVVLEEFHRQVDTNILGPLLMMQQFAQQEDADGGAIINIVTAGIATTPPFTALYVATKSALVALTNVIAKELAPRGIRVNAIAPTASDTEGTRAMGFIGSEAATQTAAAIPLGRLGLPEDIGPVAVFLASEDARFITGDVIFASGGDL